MPTGLGIVVSNLKDLIKYIDIIYLYKIYFGIKNIKDNARAILISKNDTIAEINIILDFVQKLWNTDL